MTRAILALFAAILAAAAAVIGATDPYPASVCLAGAGLAILAILIIGD
jgi:hypothetical protein